jgi:multidrug efflux pump
MLENISRYLEEGLSPMQAALQGAQQIGFTIISLTISLIAVLIPLLFMGDIVGRLFREFAVTLSVTILISAFVSLTLTPMMAARILRHTPESEQTRFYHYTEGLFKRIIAAYGRSLRWVFRYEVPMLIIAFAMLVLTVVLYIEIPKGFFPTQDTGIIQGISQAPESISFTAMARKQQQLAHEILKDPAVQSLSSFIGADGVNTTLNSGRIQINLKDASIRGLTASEVIRRLDRNLRSVPGIQLYMQPVQDLTVDDRASRTEYQYTLEDPDPAELGVWTGKLVDAMRRLPQLRDVATDDQPNGVTAQLEIDRATASRMNITADTIDSTLYDAFGQRQISTLYTQSNQYHVILEALPDFQKDPKKLNSLYVQGAATTTVASAAASTSGRSTTAASSVATLNASSTANSSTTQGTQLSSTAGSSSSSSLTSQNNTVNNTSSTASPTGSNLSTGTPTNSLSSTSSSSTSSTPANQTSGQVSGGGAASTSTMPTPVPLSAFTHFEMKPSPLTIAHQGQFPVVTVSFNVAEGSSLGQAVDAVIRTQARLHMPASVIVGFQGTAAAYTAIGGNEALLIIAALLAVYIVLGVLYESFIHPLTILSTLPSAGVGALLALRLFGQSLDIIAVIGIILLIGIVKKNGIMIVDFALEAERVHGKTPVEAIYEASLLRFRPILMTTLAALFAGIPLAFGAGIGSELRRPLGIAMVGGLLVSQVLTLYTTPIIYIFFGRIATRFSHRQHTTGLNPGSGPGVAGA